MNENNDFPPAPAPAQPAPDTIMTECSRKDREIDRLRQVVNDLERRLRETSPEIPEDAQEALRWLSERQGPLAVTAFLLARRGAGIQKPTTLDELIPRNYYEDLQNKLAAAEARLVGMVPASNTVPLGSYEMLERTLSTTEARLEKAKAYITADDHSRDARKEWAGASDERDRLYKEMHEAVDARDAARCVFSTALADPKPEEEKP